MKKYFAEILIVIAILLLPTFIFAATISELETSISELQVLITNLEALLEETNNSYQNFAPFKISCPANFHAYWQGTGGDICSSTINVGKIEVASFITR